MLPCLEMKGKKSYFTLLEIIIVITIIALVGGVVAVNIRKSFQQQRFNSEVAMLVNTLRLAQDLMIILQDDVHVIFTQAPDKGIIFWIETESPLAKNWEAVIKRSHKKLTAIHALKFRDELPGPVTMGELDVKFLSGGTVMSKGVMRLSTTDDDTVANALRSAICLYGYPHSINSFPEERWGDVCLKAQDEGYDDKVTDLTIHSIQAPHEEDESKSEEEETA